jgi:glycosyltransferase involved in cell wall biosynthesis
MSEIKISFITSIFRGAKYLEHFFESVLLIEEDIELVLIHNDPLPEELEIVERYMKRTKLIKHFRVELEGVYASWNRGILHARGEYVAMWNIDDVRTSKGVQAQAQLLDSYPDVGIVSGDYVKIFNFNSREGALKKDPVRKDPFGTYKFNNGCFLMWRKKIHEEIGYFDEQFTIAGDWEFWMRVTKYYRPARVDVVVGYYLREPNTGLSKKSFQGEAVERYVILARFYKIYVANLFSYAFARPQKIRLNEILNFNRFRQLKNQAPFNLPSKAISILFFWLTPIVKSTIELKYQILRKTSSGEQTA